MAGSACRAYSWRWPVRRGARGFGAFLIRTGIKMILKREEEIHPERNPVVRPFKKLMPVTSDYRGDRFFVRENGVRMATPLFVVLLLVEMSDLVFVGVKMILAHTVWKIDTLVSLGVIVAILTASVVISLLRPRRPAAPVLSPDNVRGA